MKQASNSLLILLNPFMALSRALVAPLCETGTAIRHTPLFFFTLLNESAFCRAIFQVSSSLRSFNPTRLGEGRIRGLLHGFLMICFLVSYATAETPRSTVEEVSSIIRAEIQTMPQWKDADIRIEISGGVRELAPGEGFRLAPKGLTITRRSVLAPMDVIRGGIVVRSLSIPVVVHASAFAVTASRKIASGETITEDDMRKSVVETTDLNTALIDDPKTFVGKIARRTFAVGDLLPREAFSEPILVRRGDMVDLRLERGGITLASSALAEENGRLGEVIRVKNVVFSSDVRARVTGRGEVSIQ